MSREANGKRVVVPMAKLFGKEVPRADEAEMSLLGSMMLDPAVVAEVRRRVVPEAFYAERHQVIYRAICDVHAASGNLDLVQLVSHLDRRELTAGVGGAEYLLQLVNGVPSASNHPYYSKIVLEAARLRNLIDVCSKTVWEAYHQVDQGDVGETVSRCLSRVAELARQGGIREPVTLMAAEAAVLEALQRGAPAMLRTGLAGFDRISDGVPQSGVWTMYGFPGGGKTTFVLSAALSIAMGMEGQDPIPVRVVSFEQGAQRIAATLLSQVCALNVHGLLNRGGVAAPEVLEQVAAAARLHANVDFAMFEDNLDPNAIYSEVAVLAEKHPRGVVVVDYVQDIPPFGQFIDQTPRITEAMRILARIARELGWLVIVVSQVGKEAGKKNEQPQLSDALGSSAIEQRSDLISFVWRPHQREVRPAGERPVGWDQDDSAWAAWEARFKRCRVGIIKNKYGRLGHKDFVFDGASMKFRNPTEDEERYWPKLRGEQE